MLTRIKTNTSTPRKGKMTKKGSTSVDKKWQSRFSQLLMTLKVQLKQATIKCYVPVLHLYFHDGTGIFSQELKQHCHMPLHCPSAAH